MSGSDSRLTELFHRVREMDGRALQELLGTLERERPEVARELRELLEFDARAGPLESGVRAGPLPCGAAEPVSAASAEFVRKLAGLSPPAARYSIQGEIGKGGQGAILRVWDETLRRHLAMKVVLGREDPRSSGPTPPVDERTLGRFLEEAQVTGQLDHPGVVPVHELAVNGEGAVYFTMRLVRGASLSEVFELVRAGKDGWSPTRALSVLLKVCETMSYAHSKGVIHRDLKPANVMVGKYGEVYVMDWGLAKVQGQKDEHDLRLKLPSTEVIHSERSDHAHEGPGTPLVTMDGTVMGTPAYMPPEQGEGRVEELGPRSDVYGVGAMLYELLTGQAPYVARGARLDPHVILAALLQGPPKTVHALSPGVPAELEAICEKAMARASVERYADMQAMAEDLRAYLEHRVVRAHRTGAVVELKKWVERNRMAASAAGVALLATVAGLSGTLAFRTRSEARAAEVRAKDRELARVESFNRLEELTEEARLLWPVAPNRIGPMEAWIERARKLEASLDPTPATGEFGYRSELAKLRERALPLSATEREQERRTHPRFFELERLEAQASSLARAQAVREGRASVDEVAIASMPQTARAANDLIWPLVNPDREVFGEEARGLALARRAVERATNDDDYAICTDTLAWACFSTGLDEEAMEMSLGALEAALPQRKNVFQASHDRLVAELEATRTGSRLQALEGELAVLRVELDQRRTWRFRHPEDTFWHGQFSRLVAEIERLGPPDGLLADDAITPEGWSIPKRLALARRLQEGFGEGGELARRWASALPSIHARYPGLTLAPQVGLVPIGPDPESGLWEFAHLATGAIPERSDDGRLGVTEEMGIVFVLLPGGRFWMGSQRDDRTQPNYLADPQRNEVPAREVLLSPFFLSKYELTQTQWLRLRRDNPSLYVGEHYNPRYNRSGRRADGTWPVQMVSWNAARETCERHDMSLPTEAQWEYAARAGTTTAWWTGANPADLAPAANLQDQYAKENGHPDGAHEPWNDGNTVSAAVGSYAASPFGLHDVHGNVFEWCLDGYSEFSYSHGKDRDPLEPPEGSELRAFRGGSFNSPARVARSAFRNFGNPDLTGQWIGLRPARAITERGEPPGTDSPAGSR